MRALASLTGVLLLLAAGCRFDANGASGGAPCATDDQCGPAEVCYRTFCVARECLDAAECGAGQQFTCADGRCHAVTCAEGCGAGYGCFPGPDGYCTPVTCSSDGDCDDGKPCNGKEWCEYGTCVPGTPVVCDPATDPCIVVVCDDAASGDPCVGAPRADGDACDDGDACTSGEACHGGACGLPTATVTCTALDQCHVAGTCDPATGACSDPAAPNGTTCDDGRSCTTGDRCAAGVCSPTASSCPCDTSADCVPLDQCHLAGTCDPGTGQCSNPAKPDGTTCDDADACTSGEACHGGTCGMPTGTVTCTPLDNCHLVGVCDPGTGQCSNPAKSCADAYSCTDDSCDLVTGNCSHAQNDALCPSQQLCRPACFGGASGCGAPPTSVTATCPIPPQWSVRNGADACTVTLAGGTANNQAACLKCTPFRGATEAFFTDFEDPNAGNPPPCSLDGWAWDGTSTCTDTSTWCPIQASGALHDARALQADRAACPSSNRTWAINRAVSAAGLSGLNVCFNAASNAASNASSLALAYSTGGTGGTYTSVFRDYGGPFSNPPFGAVTNLAWQRYCVVLPQSTDNNADVALRFTLYSNGNGEAIYLDSIGAFAYEPGCTAWTSLVNTTVSCAGPQPGWTMTGGACGTYSGNDYLYAANDTLTLTTSPALSTASVDGDLILRFELAMNATDSNDWALVEMSTASGTPVWQTVFPVNGGWGGGWGRSTFSANLSQLDRTANHSPNLLLRFTLRSGNSSHYATLDNIRLDAVAFTCDATAVTVSAPTGTGPSYSFTAAASKVEPAQLVCSWDSPATPIDDIASVDFTP